MWPDSVRAALTDDGVNTTTTATADHLYRHFGFKSTTTTNAAITNTTPPGFTNMNTTPGITPITDHRHNDPTSIITLRNHHHHPDNCKLQRHNHAGGAAATARPPGPK